MVNQLIELYKANFYLNLCENKLNYGGSAFAITYFTSYWKLFWAIIKCYTKHILKHKSFSITNSLYKKYKFNSLLLLFSFIYFSFCIFSYFSAISFCFCTVLCFLISYIFFSVSNYGPNFRYLKYEQQFVRICELENIKAEI